jgi:uncharacterized protein (TIGR02147 family)
MVIVFEYDDYVNFLSDWILSRPKRGRGVKTEMAHYMGCLPAHITKVLNRDVHLTLEQAAKTLSFLELSSLEGHYFLGLVELGRAGNRELREIVMERLEELRKKVQMAARLGAEEKEFSEKDNDTYYSNWLYMAIEMLSAIEKYQTLEAICDCLKISRPKAMEILNFMVEKGIIDRVDDKFIKREMVVRTNPSLNISTLRNHHKNWRTRALVSLDQKNENNLNFTGVLSVPREVVPQIRETLMATIKEVFSIGQVHPDPPEMAFGFCVDFFNYSSPNEE